MVHKSKNYRKFLLFGNNSLLLHLVYRLLRNFHVIIYNGVNLFIYFQFVISLSASQLVRPGSGRFSVSYNEPIAEIPKKYISIFFLDF